MRTLEEWQQLVENALDGALDKVEGIPAPLLEAMRYSLMAGGKRLRPVLLLAACDMAGGSVEEAMPYACALEMIHTYSLVHDDLPAMDNDDLRRGIQTNHKKFGEDMAILAGDGLLNTAAEIMAEAASQREDARGTRAMYTILRHAGAAGMIAGQCADLKSEGKAPNRDILRYMHMHKTADLLEAPVEAGLILAGAPREAVALGTAFAMPFGMAFQMTDDLLDVVGDPVELGKNTGMDAEQGKMTWVSLRGVEGTREDAKKEVKAAREALSRLRKEYGYDTFLLEELTDSLLTRTK